MLQGSIRFADIRCQEPEAHTTDTHRVGHWEVRAFVDGGAWPLASATIFAIQFPRPSTFEPE